MSWTNEIPTMPGYWYWRVDSSSKWTVVCVIEMIDGSFRFWTMTSQKSLPVTNDCGLWWDAPVPAPGTTWSVGELPDMTLAEAEKLWPETDYAHEAVDQDDNPLNPDDATAFFLEGYLFARKRIKDGIAATTKRNKKEPNT